MQAVIQGKGTYTYTYDAQDSSQDPFGKGHLTSTSNGSNVKTSYKHDVAGRLASTAYCMPSNCSPGYTASATYDFQNNVTSLTYPDGHLLTWTYNDLNQVLAGTYSKSGTTGTYFSNAQYAPSGAVQQMTYGNGVQFGASYDPNLNIKSLTYFLNGKALTNRTYTWDSNAANLKQVSDSAWGRTETYTYDQLDRLQTYSDTGTTASACLANVTPISPVGQTFTLDAWGNLKQSGNWSFLQDTSQNNQLQPGSSAPYYQYDNAGNLTSEGNGTTYSYSSDGVIVGSNSSSGNWLNAYDALGQKVERTSNGVWVDHFYFGGTVLGYQVSGAWVNKLYGPNGLPGVLNSTVGPDPTYRTVDHLGSLINKLTSSGDIKSTMTLLPFGQSGTAVPGADIFAFTGNELDPETMTYKTQFRNYSPTQGRWISPDPYNGSYDLTDPQSFNRYAYLNNRPMNATDPTGLCGDGDDSDCGDWNDDSGNGWSVWANGDWGGASYQLNFYYDGGGSYGNTASISANSGSDWSWGLDALQLAINVASIIPGPQAVVLNGINAGISFARGNTAEGFVYTAAATLSAFTPGAGLAAKELQEVSIAVRSVEDATLSTSALSFSQTTASPYFSRGGSLEGRSIANVADDLRAGTMTPQDLPVEYLTRDGNNLIINTRTSLALRQANVPITEWKLLNLTGDAQAEAEMTERLTRNRLTSQGTDTLRITGLGSKASTLRP
ncbi:MAG: RHS repeat-associated core domain-containing protein [Acidobacteriales bacterium]|nr:RHS repeat-associated core domain-containing protein [Terriglobales bacterium]